MPQPLSDHSPARLTLIQWVICGVACLGFAFDTYELLMLSLIVRPALTELIGAGPGTPAFNSWVGALFYVPALAGGVFGMLGGYLTDRLGRRRLLVWSILLYAFSACAAAYATSSAEFLVLRCATFVGVSVEFVAAVAWLAELFPESNQRETVLGYTQAFASVGGLMVSAAYYLAVTYGHRLPAIHGGHQAWRYTLISGLIPAVPLLVIRPFLPESPIWRTQKAAGTLKRPSFRELFRPAFRKTAWLTALMLACSYGASYGAMQHVARIVPGLPGIRELPTAAQEQAVSAYQGLQEIGGLLGRIALAFLAARVLSRRRLLRIFQVPGLALVPLVFLLPAARHFYMSLWGNLALGLMTVAQFSFWGNYLPRVYPTYLRGTGESFAANVGGRMIGTSAALLTTQLVNLMPGASPSLQLSYAAGAVGLLTFAVGLIASSWLPEPAQDLPE